ncbi:MAG: hypothetical protein R3B47_18865 [Bacteroidia bacterium]
MSWQREILPSGGTDTGALQRGGSSAIVGCVSIPTRHIHSVVEMCHKDDIQEALTCWWFCVGSSTVLIATGDLLALTCMSGTVIQLGRIQALIEQLSERLRESERQREELQQQVKRLEDDLAEISDKPIKNVEEIHQKIDSYLKDIDICLEKLNGQSQADT